MEQCPVKVEASFCCSFLGRSRCKRSLDQIHQLHNLSHLNVIFRGRARDSLLLALDPKSLILSRFPDTNEPQFLKLTNDCFIMERGPRYNEYSQLRTKRLTMKNNASQQTPDKEKDEKIRYRSILTPPKKQVKSNPSFMTRRPKYSLSIVAQSVPDFWSMLKKEKENRKPVALPSVAERSMTPPALKKSGVMYEKLGVWSKSTNSTENGGGVIMARKSYTDMEELKGLSAAAVKAINGENKGRIGRTGAVLGYRKF